MSDNPKHSERQTELSDIELTLRLGSVRIPLPGRSEKGRKLRPPRIGAPEVSGEFELEPLRRIAVREILAHADSGRAQVRIPLLPRVLKKGPFTIEIPEGARAIVDLEVLPGGVISRDRDDTSGKIEPSIDLPLGATFRGIYLNDSGALYADISRLPNLKLSWLNLSKLKIPPTLEELLVMLFDGGNNNGDDGDAPEDTADSGEHGADGDGEKSSDESMPVDLSELEVTAKNVAARGVPLELGPLGSITLGDDTRLDVEYSSQELVVSGTAEAEATSLAGASFRLRGLTARGQGRGEVRLREKKRSVTLDFRATELSLKEATVRLLDGTELSFTDAVFTGATFTYARVGRAVHFQLTAESFEGTLGEAVLVVDIGGHPHPVTVEPTRVRGGFAVSDQGYKFDLEVEGAVVRLTEHRLDFGMAFLDVAGSQTLASGKLSVDSRAGYEFTGNLSVDAHVGGGALKAGPVMLRLADGTRAQVQVNHARGDQRLRALDAHGSAELHLASGSLPVGERSRLRFSRGATGRLVLRRIAIDSESGVPTFEAGATLTAAVEALSVDGSVQFPAGKATVSLPKLELRPDATLALSDISITAKSSPAADGSDGD